MAFVLDTSGSVGPKGAAVARDLAQGILTRLPGGSEAAVFSFDDQARLVLPRTSDVGALKRALGSLKVSGRHTALYDALYDATRYLRAAPAGRRFIVLVTDGRDEDSSLELADGLRLAEQDQIPVFALGVGTPDERILRRIAKLTGGEYAPAERGSASAIAARVMERIPAAVPSSPATPAVPPSAGAPAQAAAGDAAATPPPVGSTPPKASTTSRASPAGGMATWWYVAGALAAAGGVALIVMRRRSQGPRCPQCRRPLPDALSTCAFCAEEPEAREPEDRTFAADLSPTVLARLNATEEYLEKTVTLRERPVLVVNRGPAVGRVYDLNLDSATCLGRAKANDIVVDDVAVSSEHCRVRQEDGSFVVHDLKSTNGTFVNDQKVSRHVLAIGDVLQVGETFLVFRMEHRRS